MVDVERNNRGFLFRNDRKDEDHHSDYNGSVNIEGEQYWINAWINTAKDGKKYLALTFKPKESRARTGKPLKVVGGTDAADPSDLIPF